MDQALRSTTARIPIAPYARIASAVWRWVDTYPALVRIALVYFAVVGIVSALPASRPVQRIEPAAAVATPAPYMACGIDKTFAGGRCVPVKAAPLPCVQSTRGCMATTASVPKPKFEPAPAAPPAVQQQQPADPFAGLMGIRGN